MLHRGYIITIIILILALIFAIQNTGPISLKFLVWDFTNSQALITLIILLLGFIAGWLFAMKNIWKKNQQIKSLNKQVDEMKKNIAAAKKDF